MATSGPCCSAFIAAIFFILIELSIAAFRRRSRPRTLCRAHTPTLTAFLLLICVGGVAYGLLSRDVISWSLSRLFFLCIFGDTYPSKSVRGLALFRSSVGQYSESLGDDRQQGIRDARDSFEKEAIKMS